VRDTRAPLGGHDGDVKRPRYRLWGPLLLLAGGIAFAGVGYRALALERAANEGGMEPHLEVIHPHLLADANRLMQAPRGAPLAHWRLEAPTMEGPAGALPDIDWPRLRRAVAYGEDSAAALPRLRALLHPDMPLYLRHAAALHAAPLAMSAGRIEEAESFYRLASQAQPSLLDAHDPPVRVRTQALRWLALEGLKRGDAEPLRTFLNDAEDGVRIVDGDVLGPARILQELSAEVRALAAESVVVAQVDVERLERAAAHARRGGRALKRLPDDGVVLLEDARWGLRRGFDIWLYGLDALLEDQAHAPVADVGVMASGEPIGPRSVRLPAPLETVVLTVRPVKIDGEGIVAALALALGLCLYVGGSLLVLRGWGRSRTAARQQAEFVAAVSHELKTPIASVRAMAEFMADGGVDDPARTRLYAERIEAEMQRLGASVRNVLDAAQIERGTLPVDLRPGDPAAVVETTGRAVRAALEKRGFAFAWTAQPAGQEFLLDPQALEGVLLNLVDNAVKFSGAEKEICLRGAPTPAGDYLISVLDRGRGIDPEEQGHLFRRFYRGSAAREGAAPGVGLGLHIAGQVADAHGAALSARPREGGGAAFSVELTRKV